MPTHPSNQNRLRRGFSITELLVVIGIIVLLVGILLVAVGSVRDTALRTQTEATMSSFAAACDAFQIEHGFYPGVVPERYLDDDPKLSGTENALLHLMGGFAREDDGEGPDGEDYANLNATDGWVEVVIEARDRDYKIKVNPRLIGDGPWINGKPYQPYFTPNANQFGRMTGEQIGEAPGNNGTLKLPDLLDAWGQPIVFIKQARTRGPLTGTSNPQFMYRPMIPYVQSTNLGEMGVNQAARSVLNLGNSSDKFISLAQILEHDAIAGQARGAYLLLSAGPDGAYLGVDDGAGAPGNPIVNVQTQFHTLGPEIVDEFDDVRIFGGG